MTDYDKMDKMHHQEVVKLSNGTRIKCIPDYRHKSLKVCKKCYLFKEDCSKVNCEDCLYIVV